MSSGYNVFEPEDLEFAQSILDEVWIALPSEAREGSQGTMLRERLAQQLLAAMTNENAGRDELKASLMRPSEPSHPEI